MSAIVLVTPPSPPYADIDRQAAGGMGLWKPQARTTVGHSEFAQYDLTLLSTAGALMQDGHDVHFCDGQVERLEAEPFADLVAGHAPDFIVGMVQFVCLESDLRILELIKSRCAPAPLIVVGSVGKILADEILASDDVDYVVTGLPEFATRGLLRALVRGEGAETAAGVAWKDSAGMHSTPADSVGDLRELPAMPYHLLAPYRYVDEFYFRPDKLGLVVSSRGCPFKCGYYCPYPLAYGKKVLYRRPEAVAEEIKFLNQEFGVRSFHFRDQVFTLSETHARTVCQHIIDANLDIRWLCETRLDLIRSEELLDVMRRAGCVQIDFGLESGDPDLLRGMGKPGTTLEIAEESIRKVREAGLAVHVHLIVGLPEETWSSVYNTLVFLRRLDIGNVNLNYCIPYPGTELHRDADQNGWIATRDWTRYGNAFVMPSKAMTIGELGLAYRCLNLNFLAPGYLGKRDRVMRVLLTALLKYILRHRKGRRAPESSA